MNDSPDRRLTDFGYAKVPADEKARRVGAVFSSVAGRYDVMNDLMSFGIHRGWKRFATTYADVRAGERVLDVAGGTGDLAAVFARAAGPTGLTILSDINADMLAHGRRALADRGIVGVPCVQADAEHLPFGDSSFDCVTIGFGLRNVTDKPAALRAMHRVLRPGGRVVVLEFSKPVNPLWSGLYDAYSFRILPALGRAVAGDEAAYRYLAESIRRHPGQEALLEMMRDAGLERAQYVNLSGGIVAVHRGFKPR